MQVVYSCKTMPYSIDDNWNEKENNSQKRKNDNHHIYRTTLFTYFLPLGFIFLYRYFKLAHRI